MSKMQCTPSDQMCDINHLPDELLDLIFQRGSPTPSPPKPTDLDWIKHIPEPFLKPSSLVCKRWRTIVFPLLFRSISFNGNSYVHLRPAVQVLSLTVNSPCVQFFASSPGIANYVQYLWIGDMEREQDELWCGLDRLLESLPSLRELGLVNVVAGVYNRGQASTPIGHSASHTVDVLIYTDKDHAPLYQCTTFVKLLALFAEIGELRVDVGLGVEDAYEFWDEVDEGLDALTTDALASSAQSLQEPSTSTPGVQQPPLGVRIRKLACQGGPIGLATIPAYLLRLGALEGLTHLTSTLTYHTKWNAFFSIVSASHSTLTSLSVEILSVDVDVVYPQADSIDPDITKLQPILSTCTSLSDLTIIVHLPYPDSDVDLTRALCPDGETLYYPYCEHQQHWHIILRLLQSLPPQAPLRRVKVGLRGTCTDPHVLDWRQFNEWCLRRLVVSDSGDSEYVRPSRSSSRRTLEKIEVELWQVYDQRWCMRYEMREASSMGAFVPRFELPGEDALVIGEELIREDLTIVKYECADAGCREYRDA